jgi:protocatechuate 3,4-dioxygenase beta subunit
MTKLGRQIVIGPTDNTSNERTPRNRLLLIPDAARASFVPWAPRVQGLDPAEADLTRLTPGRPRAEGDPIKVTGKVMDEFGRPIKNSIIEIWNANKYGRYSHIEDHSGLQLDPNFLGLGRTISNDQGEYEFWTIRPGAYLARPDINRWRPKHIHFSIRGGSSRLITQMYFDGDEHNDTDPMRILMGDNFHTNIGKEYETPDEDFDCGYKFDIVIGGKNPTFFENI